MPHLESYVVLGLQVLGQVGGHTHAALARASGKVGLAVLAAGRGHVGVKLHYMGGGNFRIRMWDYKL